MRVWENFQWSWGSHNNEDRFKQQKKGKEFWEVEGNRASAKEQRCERPWPVKLQRWGKDRLKCLNCTL